LPRGLTVLNTYCPIKRDAQASLFI
jgi:hypothetical protein